MEELFMCFLVFILFIY